MTTNFTLLASLILAKEKLRNELRDDLKRELRQELLIEMRKTIKDEIKKEILTEIKESLHKDDWTHIIHTNSSPYLHSFVGSLIIPSPELHTSFNNPQEACE